MYVIFLRRKAQIQAYNALRKAFLLFFFLVLFSKENYFAEADEDADVVPTALRALETVGA